MNNLNLEPPVTDLLLLDIETVPQYPVYEQLPEEWKSLWNDKISKTVPETILPEDSYTQKAGILAEFGKVICISTGFFSYNEDKQQTLRLKSIYGDDEKEVLTKFSELAEKFCKHNHNFQFAGHNIREFDIPYLCRRMLINNVPLPPFMRLHGAKPWDVKMLDTLQWWKFGDYKNYISLHLLASVLKVPTSKTDMDGSMVQHVYYKDKNLLRIVEYCQRDVVVVANVVLRFKNMPLLTEQEIIVVS
jgi:3'-5' exonuclease